MSDPALPTHRWRICAAAAVQITPGQEAEGFAALKAEVPGRSARRMSRLGLMLNHLLLQIPASEDTALLYASTFAESRTLESFLESFPDPSPLGFQSSIHPGGVEQGLILRQQSIREFLPLAGYGLMASTLFYNLRLTRAPRILLLGGEESATWLAPMRLAAAANFAFALLLEPASEADSENGSNTGASIGELRATAAPRSVAEAGSSPPLASLSPALAAPANSHAGAGHSNTSADNTTTPACDATANDQLCALAHAILHRRQHTCTGADGTHWMLDWNDNNR